MKPREGRKTTSSHVRIAGRRVFDNGLCNHLLDVHCKQVIIQFMSFQYLGIFLLIDSKDSM